MPESLSTGSPRDPTHAESGLPRSTNFSQRNWLRYSFRLLLLLIFLVLAANSLSRRVGNLSHWPENIRAEQAVVIELRASGEKGRIAARLGDSDKLDLHEEAEITQAVERATKDKSKTVVLLRSAAGVRHRELVRVLDAVRRGLPADGQVSLHLAMLEDD